MKKIALFHLLYPTALDLSVMAEELDDVMWLRVEDKDIDTTNINNKNRRRRSLLLLLFSRAVGVAAAEEEKRGL